MGFHLRDFAARSVQSSIATSCSNLPAFPSELQHCLVAGPERSGKTSLLLHFAHSRAAAGDSVLFVCHRGRIENSPPVLPLGVAINDEALHRVHMRYLETAADLQKLAACLHLAAEPPAAIIVDDISSFFGGGSADRGRDQALIRTLALLHDSTNFASSRRGVGRPCQLVISDTSATEVPRMMYIYQRWLPLVLTIHAAEKEGGHALSAHRSVADTHDLAPGCLSQLVYSLTTHSAVALEAVLPPRVVEPPQAMGPVNSFEFC